MKYIALIIVILVLSGCSSDRCFKKAGETGTMINEFSSFDVLNIYGVFVVELIEDSIYYIEASAREQALKGIEFEKINDTLNCYYYNSCFWRRDYDRPSLRIHYTAIKQVNVMESAYVFSVDTLRDPFLLSIRADVAETNLIVNTTNIYMYNNKSSSGHFIFRGKVDYATLISYYAGFYDMAALECKSANIINHSVLDMSVNVKDKLNVSIYNKGNILYSGNPEIIIDTLASSGRIIPLTD